MVSVFESLRSFDPRVRPYLECLMQNNSKISLTDDDLKITDPFSGLLSTIENQVPKHDRFKLKIPYAQQTITWEIIFDVANWKEPPDFIFEAEAGDFYPPLEKINSLVCWEWQNKESLVALVCELLELYKFYQLERAEANQTLNRHFSSLMSKSPDSMQVMVNRSESGIGTVNVVGKLEVDFSNIPSLNSSSSPGGCASLHVCFPYPESSNVHSQLIIPPHVEKALGGPSCLRIPVFQQGTLLGEYFSSVTQLLRKQVDNLSDGLEKRKEFIAALDLQFPGSVLEYDSQKCYNIVFLLEWNDFFFCVTVDLPSSFPLEDPTYTFKSVYHYHDKLPYTEKHEDIPWSPRWSTAEMARRASEYILGNIRTFQRSSVTSSDT